MAKIVKNKTQHKYFSGGSLIDRIKFQYYGTNVHDVTYKGFISLKDFLELHISNENKQLFSKIAEAEASGNNQLKAELKQQNLRSFTPCVVVGKYQNNGYTSNKPTVFGYKDYAHIEKFTGLMVLDFDHLDKFGTKAENLKQYIYRKYSCVVACWLSPSHNGVKCLVKIPIVKTVKEFQEYHDGFIQQIKDIKGLDTTTKNCTLSLFQSFDKDLLFRSDPTIWTTKYIKPKPKPIERVRIKTDITDKDRKTVLKIILTGFNNITSTTGGHHKLRSLCISIGGYVASGYITETEAKQIVDYLINQHSYLEKGINGYVKTAYKFIKEGQKQPIQLNYKKGE